MPAVHRSSVGVEVPWVVVLAKDNEKRLASPMILAYDVKPWSRAFGQRFGRPIDRPTAFELLAPEALKLVEM